MSNSWPLAPLSELLTKSEEWIDIKPEERYREITVRLWGKGVALRREVSGTEIAASRRLRVKAGQFILSRIDARNGAFGLVPDSLDGAVVSNDFPVFTPNSSKILPLFLRWMSKTHDFVNICKAASEGTTNRVRLQEERFLAMKIPLPSLPEQRRIVARIEELAAKIEEALRLRPLAVEEGELLFRSNARRIFSGLTKYGTKSLRNLVTVVGGGTPSKANPFFWQGAIPWISPKDMKSREITDASDHISKEAVVESAAKLLDPGCVLVVVRGMILSHTVPSAVLRVPATINQDMKALIPNNALLAEYLCTALWALNDDLVGLVEKSTHDTRKLETQKLLDFRMPVPDESEQYQIVAYVDGLQAKAETVKRLQAETAAELDAMPPSILDRAFKGELL